MSSFSFQIMSDLHLETPKSRPSYEDFQLDSACSCLALLGDIGNTLGERLFHFLERQVQQFDLVLYVLGNHEPYGITYLAAKSAFRAFEADIARRRSHPAKTRLRQFILLDKRRVDVSKELTVLGCTLFSCIREEQNNSVATFVSDFSEIDDWNIDNHNLAHENNLNWLNSQGAKIGCTEPNRQIVILTHYSPTMIDAANDPRHSQDNSEVQSAFVTDLSDQECWTSRQVKLWAFGHTHFNCDLVDKVTGKRIVANQKGYRRTESLTFDVSKVVTVDNALAPASARPESIIQGPKNTSRHKKCVVA